MNDRLSALILLLLLGFAAGCQQQPSTEPPPLAGARLGGSFSLIDQNGRGVTDRQFDGRYRLIYFGYTFCPDVCPVDLQTIGQAMRQLEREVPGTAEHIQPIFITTDPARDTPAVLKDYVAAFHPRLIGLTGPPDRIAETARNFGVVFQKREDAGASDYLVDHSRIALLFGPKGEPIAILPHDEGAEAVAAELRRWVK